jgi:hypothetical protein
MGVAALNQILTNPPSMQDKLNAMEELAMRNDVDANTFELLKRNLDPQANPTGSLTGVERMNAVDAKRAAALSLSMLNGRLNPGMPARDLPGFQQMVASFNDKNESPEVKKAILQGLRVLNRPNDPDVKRLARLGLKSRDTQIRQLADAIGKGTQFEFAGAAPF